MIDFATVRESTIGFSAAMVRAILDGRKTETRRPIRPQPIRRPRQCHFSSTGWAQEGEPNEYGNAGCNCYDEVRCPFWPVDRLRISEAVTVTAVGDDAYQVRYHADGSIVERFGTPELIAKIRAYKTPFLRGVSLPPAYARDVRLVVTDVEPQLVGEITDEQSLAEGLRSFTKDGRLYKYWACDPVDDAPPPALRTTWQQMPTSPRLAFAALWDATYGTGAFAAGGYVWRVPFTLEREPTT